MHILTVGGWLSKGLEISEDFIKKMVELMEELKEEVSDLRGVVDGLDQKVKFLIHQE